MSSLGDQVEAAVASAVRCAQGLEALAPGDREASVEGAREAIQAAIDTARAAHPLASAPLVQRLSALAARLLDVLEVVGVAPMTTTITLTAERGVLDLAWELYRDPARGAELMEINSLREPWAIPAGTVLVVYV